MVLLVGLGAEDIHLVLRRECKLWVKLGTRKSYNGS